MRFCQDCGLSIGETATFCATCGAVAPVAEPVVEPIAQPVTAAAPVSAASNSKSAAPESAAPESAAPESVAPSSLPAGAGPGPAVAAPERPACRLCRRESPRLDSAGVCQACRADIAVFVAAQPRESLGVSLATGAAGAGGERLTIVNAIYTALADEGTCAHCRAMDGRETTDAAVAATWAPNPSCSNPAGCRCLVFFEHESLSLDEELEFVDYAAEHGLHVTAPAVAAFHDAKRKRRERLDGRLEEAAGLLREARPLERSDPQQAVTLYRKAVEGLLACGETPLDERRVRRDLPLAFNRLSLVLEGTGCGPEALDEVDRAASLGLLERADCGRKSDREALRNRGRRLRERLGAPVPGIADPPSRPRDTTSSGRSLRGGARSRWSVAANALS